MHAHVCVRVRVRARVRVRVRLYTVCVCWEVGRNACMYGCTITMYRYVHILLAHYYTFTH